MSFFANKDKRQYVAAGVFMMLVIMLMLFLTYIKIPVDNKDLVVSIISMLVGRSSIATDTLFGGHDTQFEELKKRIDDLERENALIQADRRVIKEEYDQIVKLLVGRIDIGAKDPLENV